jgi:AbrB family looped-hinge helix DNA binding protein
MKSAISSKGQITVPVSVREKLGLLPGTIVHFRVVNGGAVIRKGTPGAHPVDRVYGKLRLDRPVDALIDELRGPRPTRSRRP